MEPLFRWNWHAQRQYYFKGKLQVRLQLGFSAAGESGNGAADVVAVIDVVAAVVVLLMF